MRPFTKQVFPHLHSCKSFHEVDDEMVVQVGHNRVDSAVRMTMKDCHNTCVLCFGQNRASLAREIPSSCINCFILAARSVEADSCSEHQWKNVKKEKCWHEIVETLQQLGGIHFKKADFPLCV